LSFGVKAAEQTEVQTKDAATEGKHWRRFSFRFLSWLFPVSSCSWPLSYLVVSQSERQEDRQPVTGFPIHLLEQTLWDRAWFIFPCCSRSSLGARRICQVFL